MRSLKHIWLTIWQFLNRVHPYQATLYAGLFLWGLYSSLLKEPLAMAQMMPDTVYRIWLAMHIVAPLVVWLGQLLHCNDPGPKATLLGWELQWTGDAAIFFIAATTAYAFSSPDKWSHPYIVVAFSSWAICVLLLAIRDGVAIGYYWGACHPSPGDSDGD